MQRSWSRPKRPVELSAPQVVFTPAHIQRLILQLERLIYVAHRGGGGLRRCGILPPPSFTCISVSACISLTSLSLSNVLFRVMQVPRHAGPPYTAHDITKGHPSLAGTPPGHAHSAALSQVSVPTASQYRYPKGWEAGGGVSL